MISYRYRPGVLAALLAHGVRPTPATPPGLVRDYLNDLYRFQLRRLRAQLVRGDFPKRQYAGRVTELRLRYPLLSLPLQAWTE